MFPGFPLSLWQRFNPRCPHSRHETWLLSNGHERREPKPYRNHRSSQQTLPPSAPPLPSLSTASPTNTQTALQPHEMLAWCQRAAREQGSPAGDSGERANPDEKLYRVSTCGAWPGEPWAGMLLTQQTQLLVVISLCGLLVPSAVVSPYCKCKILII